MPRPSGDYVAFLGRISPEKRADRAIEIARRAGMKIRIAAKVDAADRDYFQTQIEPLLSQPHVEYVGEIGERDKCEFLGNARALLFPIDWPEPFGLVMIEAMSCGTPCVAWRAGSVPGNHPGGTQWLHRRVDRECGRRVAACGAARPAHGSCLFPAAILGRTHDPRLRGDLPARSPRAAQVESPPESLHVG